MIAFFSPSPSPVQGERGIELLQRAIGADLVEGAHALASPARRAVAALRPPERVRR
jgi:hypothetical protein